MSVLVYRILKWTLLGVLVLGVLAVVLFSIFILNPFEGRLESIESIVPPSLNLFAAKEVADEEASGFLRTEFWQRLTNTRAYQIWVRSPEWRTSGAAHGLQNLFQQLNIVEDSFQVDPLAEIAGREIGLGLRFEPNGPPQFLLYLRLSFLARASVACLENETVRNLLTVPIEGVPNEPDLLRLPLQDGGELKDVYLTRLLDVLVVGSDRTLVKTTRKLARGEGDAFRNRVGTIPRGSGNPIGFRMSPDPGELASTWSRTVVDPGLDELSRTFVEAVDPAGLTGLSGRFFLTRSPHLEVDAGFLAGSLRPFQRALVESPVPDLPAALEPFVHIAPRDLMAFVYAHLDPRKVGTFLEDALDPETRKLVEDTLAPTPLKNLHTLLDRWLGSLEPGIALYLNRQDFPTRPTNPPYPGVTLLFRMKDPDLWQRIHFDLLDHLKKDLTIERGRFDQPRADVELMYYTFQANPYADVAAPCFARFGSLVAFSTSVDFLNRMRDIYMGEGRYGLARSGEVTALFEGPRRLDTKGSLFAFVDIRRSLRWLDDMAPSMARASALAQQLENAPSKRKSLEFRARSLPALKSPKEREQWVDEQMERWYRVLDDQLKQRIGRVIGPMVKNLGIVHTAGLTLGRIEDGDTPGLRLRATFNFDP